MAEPALSPFRSRTSRRQAKAANRAPALRLLRTLVDCLPGKYREIAGMPFFLGLLTLLAPAYLLYFTRYASVATPGASFAISLFILGTLAALASLLTSGGGILRRQSLRACVEAELRRRMLTHLQRVPLGAPDGEKQEEELRRLTHDLEGTEIFLSESLPGQFRELAGLLGSGAILLWYGGWLGILPLMGALALAGLQFRALRGQARVAAELEGTRREVLGILMESVAAIRTIRSHSGEPFLLRRFERKLGEAIPRRRSAERWLGNGEAGEQILVTICLSAVGLALTRRALAWEEALAYPFFLGAFSAAARSLARAPFAWREFFENGGRIESFLRENEAPALPGYSISGESLRRVSALEASGLRLGDTGPLSALTIHFTLAKGELWAVTGPPGCGKSTFLEVLAGLRRASAGKLVLEDESDFPVWESSKSSGVRLPLGPSAYLEKNPYLFEGTLRENLTFGNPLRLSDAVLWKGLESLGLYALARSGNGLEQVLREGGRTLSRGERYRIALCRALLLGRPFLLLDEPFAGMDDGSRKLIVAALNAQRATTGMIVASESLPQGLSLDGVFDFRSPDREDESLMREVAWTLLPPTAPGSGEQAIALHRT